jgi:hypothetical protein
MNLPVRIREGHLIAFIVIAGAILRLWHFFDIPFTHDEFSAIIRSQYSTFSELIEQGVRVDGHPAGIQVLIWILVRIFGISAPLIKTPFIIFSLLSVWLIYKVGKQWFNSTTGLISAAFLSFLQFPVMYGQLARPYAAGLFFILLFTLFWTKIVFHPEKRRPGAITGFAISAALSAYTHHFAMLFVVIAGITGIFLTEKRFRWKYILLCLFPVFLYIPHVSILLSQLQTGGVEGWLHKPRLDFILDFSRYVFHFSMFTGFILIILLFLAYQWRVPEVRINKKMWFISLIWFISVCLTGFLYSVFRSAVLQYSVLIFVFPFFLFLFTGLLTTQSRNHQAMLVLLLTALIPSLIEERQHYTLFYKNPYREMIRESVATRIKYADSASIVLDTKKEIHELILSRIDPLPFMGKFLEDIGTRGKLVDFLGETREKTLGFGCLASTSWENYAVIQSVYPYLKEHICYAGGDYYVFSKDDSSERIDEYFLRFRNTFKPSLQEWINFNPQQLTDSSAIDGNISYQCDTSSAFSPTFQKGLRDLIRSDNDVVDISVDMQLPLVFPGAWIIATLTSGDKTIYWGSMPVTDFIKPGTSGRAFLSLRMSDMDLRHHQIMLTSYIWTPGKVPYLLDNYTVAVRKGNPVIYGLIRPIR